MKAIFDGKKSKRGRPNKIDSPSKIASLVASLLDDQVPDAVLLIDHTFKCLQE